MAASITLNSNIASLNSERRLGESTARLERSYTRLSSGLRINRASDDAAGLSISESLNTDAKVFAQGIKNLNDAIGLLTVSESALSEMSSILIRQRELAEQAANGTLSLPQRRALDEEANELVKEFNRIAASTAFNGILLLDRSSKSIRAQGGFGVNGGIDLALGAELARLVGDGSFSAGLTLYDGSVGPPRSLQTADFNGDGSLDVAFADPEAEKIFVTLGNGDGSFDSISSYAISAAQPHLASGDIDGDGDIDLFAAGISGIDIMLNDGKGGFALDSTLDPGGGPWQLQIVDLNNDGAMDIAGSMAAGNSLFSYLSKNDGSGQFEAVQTFSIGFGGAGVSSGDFDSDGNLDLVVGAQLGNQIQLWFGQGDGSFIKETVISGMTSAASVKVEDLDHDGDDDFAISGSSELWVFTNDGQGSFTESALTYDGTLLDLVDVNSDGKLDLVTSNNNALGVRFGNDDATFGELKETDLGSGITSLSFADFDKDGALDSVINLSASGDVLVFDPNTQEATTMQTLYLLTEESARESFSVIDAGLQRVNLELGAIGSSASRLGTALNNLMESRLNYDTARSRITDADVAEESAGLVKNRIIQQAGAAVLSQANQEPELALLLLRGSS